MRYISLEHILEFVYQNHILISKLSNIGIYFSGEDKCVSYLIKHQM